MRPARTSIAVFTVLAIAFSTTALAQSSLEAGFKSPPASARPHTWWHWINGNISKEGITADLEAMKRIGLGGAQIFNVEVGVPEGKVPFMSPQWKEALAHAFKEAKRLGIEICVHNCAGWSSSGGPWVKPEHAMQFLTWSETTASGPRHFTGVLPQPSSKLGYYKDIAVFAVKQPGDTAYRIPDIRRKAAFERGDRIAPEPTSSPGNAVIEQRDVMVVPMAADGSVNIDLPDGEWVLIRMGHTPTGKENHPSPASGLGPECDKMSREAMDEHWAGMMQAALIANGPVGPNGLNNALIDSYEVHSQNWTPKFREEFQRRRGYDPMPYLPVTTGRVIGSAEVSERFLWDFRRTICDLFADNYFQYFGELCHKNGLQFSTEGYGDGSFDNLQVSGMADIPMGEFWVYGGMAMETTKIASSAAHTNGRKVVGAESFTADDNQGRFRVDPYSIKALGDRIFTLGINRYIFHRYAHQPWMDLKPGMTMGPWGMHLDRTETWWEQGKEWMKYIARCQFLLQSGRFVADVLAFTGEEGPNDLPMLGGNTVPYGYDYDGCDASVLMKASVESGQIVLPSGMRYRVLLLPPSKWMTPRILSKISELVQAGATILGEPPLKSPSLTNMMAADRDVQRMAGLLWSSDGTKGVNTVGSGRVFWGVSLAEVLSATGVNPDVQVVGQKLPALNWIHRKTDEGDVYFVTNPKYRPVTIEVTFRDSGHRVPELWNPETGATTTASDWTQYGGVATVNLPFESAGSVFVVFRKKAEIGQISDSWHVKRLGSEVTEPKLEVISARYEAIDGSGGADVTDKVAAMVASGDSEISATNANFGDPSVNHVKRLILVYSLNGQRREASVQENGSIELVGPTSDGEAPDFILEGQSLTLFKGGKYLVKHGQGPGSTSDFQGSKETPLSGAWTVGFPRNTGAPSSARFNTLKSLSESDVAGIRYFSGTATYETTFPGPSGMAGNQRVFLDLGKVKNFAEVTLNGHTFSTMWKAPFRLDVTKWLKRGANALTVKVTNLWPNRLIGDEQFPQEVQWNGAAIASWPKWLEEGRSRPKSQRVAFTTWRFYNKDSQLLESGLIGPVVVNLCTVVKLK